MTIEAQLAKNVITLLMNVGDQGECRGCKAEIYWVTHKNGRKTPYTPEGLNHFVNCPAAERFRKAKEVQ